MLETLTQTVKKLGQQKQTVIFLAGLVGILLIAFAGRPSQKAQATGVQPVSETPATQSYTQQLETRLETILGSIAGVGRVRVLVTLQSGYGYEYAKENKTGSDKLEDIRAEETQKTQEKNTSEESYVMVDGGSGNGKQPLITRELEPSVAGVVVVCDGGADPTVVTSVIDTVRVAVNVSSVQISVARMVQNTGIK